MLLSKCLNLALSKPRQKSLLFFFFPLPSAAIFDALFHISLTKFYIKSYYHFPFFLIFLFDMLSCWSICFWADNWSSCSQVWSQSAGQPAGAVTETLNCVSSFRDQPLSSQNVLIHFSCSAGQWPFTWHPLLHLVSWEFFFGSAIATSE